jgi:Family of unknown function (DUF5681)
MRGQHADRDNYQVGYGKPPRNGGFHKGRSGNPRGKNLPALLVDALNEKVAATIDGERREITKREAVVTQLVSEAADANLRATNMLIDMLGEIERKADPVPGREKPVQPDRQRGGPTADRQAAPQHVQRLSLRSATGCSRTPPALAPAAQDAMAAD